MPNRNSAGGSDVSDAGGNPSPDRPGGPDKEPHMGGALLYLHERVEAASGVTVWCLSSHAVMEKGTPILVSIAHETDPIKAMDKMRGSIGFHVVRTPRVEGFGRLLCSGFGPPGDPRGERC